MKRTAVTILSIAILGILVVATHHKTPVSSLPTNNNSGALSPTSSTSTPAKNFRSGIYTGSLADTPYGTVQIAVVINKGKISDVNFLKMPSDFSYSQQVSSVAGPILKQETLTTQSANIDFVSGATSTSTGYEQSLQAALDQARLA